MWYHSGLSSDISSGHKVISQWYHFGTNRDITLVSKVITQWYHFLGRGPTIVISLWYHMRFVYPVYERYHLKTRRDITVITLFDRTWYHSAARSNITLLSLYGMQWYDLIASNSCGITVISLRVKSVIIRKSDVKSLWCHLRIQSEHRHWDLTCVHCDFNIQPQVQR